MSDPSNWIPVAMLGILGFGLCLAVALIEREEDDDE